MRAQFPDTAVRRSRWSVRIAAAQLKVQFAVRAGGSRCAVPCARVPCAASPPPAHTARTQDMRNICSTGLRNGTRVPLVADASASSMGMQYGKGSNMYRASMSRAGIDGAFRSGRLSVRFRYLLLATTIFGGSFLIMATNTRMNIIFLDQHPSDSQWETHRYTFVDSEQSHTIKTEGCSIPAMKPISPAIKKYVRYPSGLKPCPDVSRSLLDADKKNIWIIKKNLSKYNLSDTKNNLLCCYQAFYRPTSIEDITSSSVDSRVKYDDCKFFSNTITVKDEFVRVKCLDGTKKLIYEQFFLFAPKKKFMKHDGKKEKTNNEPEYNVLIIGIDGVSRLNFHRTMPETLNFLKSKGAVDLKGYNKVGDNTFPNLVAMLMGIKDSEIKKVCHPHSKATFDNCPFIWEWFKQAGFYTALGEDCSNLGTFNYIKVGFSNTPTDYYIHPFIHQAEHNVGSNKDGNSKLCMHNTFFYKVLLNYIEDLTTTLKNNKLFGFFWEITMSHDYLNYPMVMDDDYVQFFKKLEAKEYLNDSIVIVMSDHGIRWGGIRSTKQGRLEERLPFLYVLTPPSFPIKYSRAYEHLKVNSQRLTTPFDLYATLSDLIDLRNINDTSLLTRSTTNYAHNRGISLFLPVPSNRTCKAADIDDHWCTCHKDIAVSKMNPKVLSAAVSLVLLLNEMLVDYPQCASLVLDEVLDATMMEVGTPEQQEKGWVELMVVVRTVPGGGIFEATLRKENEWAIVGAASRLNLYGNQSDCVQNTLLKLYCYCGLTI